MVGYETVEQVERCTHQAQRTVYLFVVTGHLLVPVVTAEGGHLTSVLCQCALYGVRVVLALHIHKLRAERTHVATLVAHVPYLHVAGHGYLFLLVHHQVVVTVQQTRDMGHVGDGGRQLVQVETVQADGEVLQQRRVLVFRIDPHTRAVVGQQTHLGLQPEVVLEEQEVVVVEREHPVADSWVAGQQVEAQSVVLHLYLCSQAQGQLVLVVIEAYAQTGTVLLQQSVDGGGEDKLRIPAVVGYAALEGQSVVGLVYKCHVDGVYACGVGIQAEQMGLAVDTRDGRCVHVDQQFLEVRVGHRFQEVRHGVVAPAGQVQACRGQQCLQGGLVYDAAVEL